MLCVRAIWKIYHVGVCVCCKIYFWHACMYFPHMVWCKANRITAVKVNGKKWQTICFQTHLYWQDNRTAAWPLNLGSKHHLERLCFFSAMADDASEPPAKRQRFMDLGNFCFLLSFGSVFGCLGPTAGLAIIKILGSEAFCACGRPALLAKSRH